MTKKSYKIFCILVIFLLLINNTTAIEETKKSTFTTLNKFLKNLFRNEERIVYIPVENASNESKTTVSTKEINHQRLQNITASSNCLKQLPKNSAIRLYIFYNNGEDSDQYFLSFGPLIHFYDEQKFDISIGLNYKELLGMENFSSVDIEFKRNLNSKGLIFSYKNIFKALKYKEVFSCIDKIKIGKINESEYAEKANFTIKIPIEMPNEQPPVIEIFNKTKLNSQKFKMFFDDVRIKQYTVIVKDLSDYSNLRATKILASWGDFNFIDNGSLNWSEQVSKGNLILMGYPCNNNFTSLVINESDCNELIKDQKGLIKFYEYDSKKLLIIIGKNGQDLVDSAYILINEYLFDFNETYSITTNESMYKLANSPQRIKEIINKLQSIYRNSEDYEELVSDRKLLWFAPYHPGKMFEAVQSDLNADRYKISDESKEILRQFNFGDLAYKGNEVIKQRELVRNEIKKVQNPLKGIVNLKIDKNIISLEPIEEYENKLETAQKNQANLEKEYNKLTEMTEEIKVAWVKIQQLLGSNFVYSRTK